MKASELVKLIENEINKNGDEEITVNVDGELVNVTGVTEEKYKRTTGSVRWIELKTDFILGD